MTERDGRKACEPSRKDQVGVETHRTGRQVGRQDLAGVSLSHWNMGGSEGN